MEKTPSQEVLDANQHPMPSGDWNVVFWVVLGLALAFVAYLVLDAWLARRREKELREKWQRARSRPDAINSNE